MRGKVFTRTIRSCVDSTVPLKARASITSDCPSGNPEMSTVALQYVTGPPTADQGLVPERTCTRSAWPAAPRTTKALDVTLDPLEGDVIATVGGGPFVTVTWAEQEADRC